MINAKWLRKYTAYRDKKIWKAKCRAHRALPLKKTTLTMQ